jgi:4-hydroxybenzoate polyprenyltransferase
MRWHQPTGWLLAMWPGLWGLYLAPQDISASKLMFLTLVMMLGAFLARSAGCIVNDLADREFDIHVERTKDRPLASGEITPGDARGMLRIIAGLALLLMLPLQWEAWPLCLLAGGMAAIYPYMKRFFAWPQLWLGLTFSMAVPIGALGGGGYAGFGVWMLYLANTCWTLGYDTIYACQDKKDDANIGIHSTALWAKHKVRKLIAFSYCIAAMAMFLGVACGSNGVSLLGGLTGATGFAAHLAWQLQRLDENAPHLCGRLFRFNGLTGLLPAAGLLFGALVERLI